MLLRGKLLLCEVQWCLVGGLHLVCAQLLQLLLQVLFQNGQISGMLLVLCVLLLQQLLGWRCVGAGPSAHAAQACIRNAQRWAALQVPQATSHSRNPCYGCRGDPWPQHVCRQSMSLLAFAANLTQRASELEDLNRYFHPHTVHTRLLRCL